MVKIYRCNRGNLSLPECGCTSFCRAGRWGQSCPPARRGWRTLYWFTYSSLPFGLQERQPAKDRNWVMGGGLRYYCGQEQQHGSKFVLRVKRKGSYPCFLPRAAIFHLREHCTRAPLGPARVMMTENGHNEEEEEEEEEALDSVTWKVASRTGGTNCARSSPR